MAHRDRAGDPPGRREAAGDAGHRHGFPTPSGGSPARPERRLPKAFGRPITSERGAWLPMPRIAAPRAPGRKPWEAVSMGHYRRSLVLPVPAPRRLGERRVEGEQRQLRWLVGPVRGEGPARPARDRAQPGALRVKPRHVVLAHRFDARQQPGFLALQALETDPSVVGQRPDRSRDRTVPPPRSRRRSRAPNRTPRRGTR